MGKTITFVALLVVLIGPRVQASQSVEFNLQLLSERSREAYFTLQGAIMFRMGSVGFMGTTSPEESALRDLLYDIEAIPALKSLSRNATTAGRLYALLGLRIRDINAFREEAQLYRERSEQDRDRSEPVEKSPRDVLVIEDGTGSVLTQSGCLVIPEQQESILRKIELGVYGGNAENKIRKPENEMRKQNSKTE